MCILHFSGLKDCISSNLNLFEEPQSNSPHFIAAPKI